MNKRDTFIVYFLVSVGSLIGEVFLNYDHTFNSLLFIRSGNLNSNSFIDKGELSLSLKEDDLFFTLGVKHKYINIDISKFFLDELEILNIGNSRIEKKTFFYYPEITLGYKNSYFNIVLSDNVSYDLNVEFPLGNTFYPGFRFTSCELFEGNISLLDNYSLINAPEISSYSFWFKFLFNHLYLRFLTEAISLKVDHTLKENELGFYLVTDGNRYIYNIGYDNEIISIGLDINMEEYLLPDNIYGYLGNKVFLTSPEESEITYKSLYTYLGYYNTSIGFCYDNLDFSRRSLSVNSYPFIYGPLIYRVYEIDIPTGRFQIIGGDIKQDILGKKFLFNISLAYKHVILDIEDIEYLYNEYTLLQFLPKIIGYSNIEYFDPWKNNIHLLSLDINYNFQLSDSYILGIKFNQLIPLMLIKEGDFIFGGSQFSIDFTWKL